MSEFFEEERKMKRMFMAALILTIVGSSLIFARGGSQGGGTSSGAAAKTVVTIWTHNRHDLTFMQDKIAKYNASNTDNIEAKLEVYTDNYTQAVDLVFQSGDAPDIFSNNDTIYVNHVNSGRFADLNPLMDAAIKNNYSSLMFEGVNMIDGKCYWLPTMATTNRLFYNKDIFKRVGVTEPPKSLEEMVAIAKKITTELKSEGIYGFAQNMKSAQMGLDRSLDPMINRELGLNRGYDFAKGEYDFTGYYNALMAWKELLSPPVAFPGSESLDIDPLRAQFAAGKIAMYFSWTHAEPGVYASQFPTTQDWGAAQIPVTGGVVRGAQHYRPSNGYLLNANSKNLQASWKVLSGLILDTDLLTEYYEAGLGIAVVPAVIARAKPAKIYAENPAMLITPTDAILKNSPHQENPNAVIVEGMNYFDTCASIIWGATSDPRRALTDLTDRYNRAYRAGIAQGIGKEIRIPGYDPLKP
jgi:multiple sugar transport system substrate-binding protein